MAIRWTWLTSKREFGVVVEGETANAGDVVNVVAKSGKKAGIPETVILVSCVWQDPIAKKSMWVIKRPGQPAQAQQPQGQPNPARRWRRNVNRQQQVQAARAAAATPVAAAPSPSTDPVRPFRVDPGPEEDAVVVQDPAPVQDVDFTPSPAPSSGFVFPDEF